jgi:hypothetical protein
MRLDDSPSGGVFAFSAGIAIKVVAASHDQVLNFGGEATVGDCARYWARDEISLVYIRLLFATASRVMGQKDCMFLLGTCWGIAWTLGPGYSAGSIALSPDASAGSGCLYIGNTGNGSSGTGGITGATFTENPLNLTYVNNVTSTLPTYVGSINTITNQGDGTAIYAAESAGYIGVYSAKTDCSVFIPSAPSPYANRTR